MKKLALFLKNLGFYITNFYKIKKKNRQEKLEQIRTEKQAERILKSDVFNGDFVDW